MGIWIGGYAVANGGLLSVNGDHQKNQLPPCSLETKQFLKLRKKTLYGILNTHSDAYNIAYNLPDEERRGATTTASKSKLITLRVKLAKPQGNCLY